MDSSCDTACAVGCPIRRSRDPQSLALPPSFSQRATSFIASRCQGIHQMPFSSSSPTPSPKHAAQPRAEGRWQDAEGSPRCCLLPSDRCLLEPEHKAFAPPGLAPRRTLRIPMPRSSQTERLDRLHGHDSLHDFRDQRTVVSSQISDGSATGRHRRRLDAKTSLTSARHSDDRFKDARRQPTPSALSIARPDAGAC
jgi:hypothetical protein